VLSEENESTDTLFGAAVLVSFGLLVLAFTAGAT
jgi:hypothetical protein